jgi:hypothetical protein
MTLFKNNKKEFSTEEEIEEALNSLKQVWFDLAEGKLDSKNGKTPWKQTVSKMPSFEPQNSSSYQYQSRING